jgi:hypothetical protein
MPNDYTNPYPQRADRKLRVARRPGFCEECGQPYAAGDDIWWARGIGAAHPACQAQAVRPAVGKASIHADGWAMERKLDAIREKEGRA